MARRSGLPKLVADVDETPHSKILRAISANSHHQRPGLYDPRSRLRYECRPPGLLSPCSIALGLLRLPVQPPHRRTRGTADTMSVIPRGIREADDRTALASARAPRRQRHAARSSTHVTPITHTSMPAHVTPYSSLVSAVRPTTTRHCAVRLRGNRAHLRPFRVPQDEAVAPELKHTLAMRTCAQYEINADHHEAVHDVQERRCAAGLPNV